MSEYNNRAPLAVCPKGGKVRWSSGLVWPARSLGGSSTFVSVRAAASTPTAKWHESIAPSIASWLLPTNAPAACWLGLSPASTAAAALLGWPAAPGWPATLSPAADANSASLSARPGGFVGREREANASKKKSWGPECPGGVAPRHRGGRPSFRPE